MTPAWGTLPDMSEWEYDHYGNRRPPRPEPEMKQMPEGTWTCLDCGQNKSHTLMATWVPDMLSLEGKPVGSCGECHGGSNG